MPPKLYFVGKLKGLSRGHKVQADGLVKELPCGGPGLTAAQWQTPTHKFGALYLAAAHLKLKISAALPVPRYFRTTCVRNRKLETSKGCLP